jgi:hypothetical protein
VVALPARFYKLLLPAANGIIEPLRTAHVHGLRIRRSLPVPSRFDDTSEVSFA